MQVAQLIEKGLSNAQIGEHLGMARGTVRIHIKALNKLGVTKRRGPCKPDPVAGVPIKVPGAAVTSDDAAERYLNQLTTAALQRLYAAAKRIIRRRITRHDQETPACLDAGVGSRIVS